MAAADARTGIATSQLSYALGLGGRHSEAAALIGDELDRQARIGTLRRFRPFLVTDLVDSYVELGRWDEAVALCEAELAQADGGRPAPGISKRWARSVPCAATWKEPLSSSQPRPRPSAPGCRHRPRLADAHRHRPGSHRGQHRSGPGAIDEALSISADTAHDALLWWLLCAALAAEADEADRATRRRDADRVATAQARGLRLARILDEAAGPFDPDDARWPPTLRAYVRHGRRGSPSARWTVRHLGMEAAIEAYDDLGYIYEAASCRLHLAETVLAAGGAREEAAAAFARPPTPQRRLRAEPLLAAVAGLAGRARIDLGTETGGEDDLGVGLTAREQEVLGLLAGGLTNREIGEALFISEKTASVHVSNILGKLGVGGRGAAVAMALRLGFEVDADRPTRRIGGSQPSGVPHVATGLPDDPDEVAQVVERPNVRRRSVDRADRDPRDRASEADARRDHLDLELEAALVAAERRLHDPPPDQPVAGLVVGDRPADGPRERPAAELVGEPARRRHRPEVAPADDEVRSRVGLERGHELRDLGRVVLAVGVERQDRVVAVGERLFEASRSAAPLPLFGRCSMTVAPAARACSAVSSAEPSSTTRTGRCSRVARTTGPIRGPSL